MNHRLDRCAVVSPARNDARQGGGAKPQDVGPPDGRPDGQAAGLQTNISVLACGTQRKMKAGAGAPRRCAFARSQDAPKGCGSTLVAANLRPNGYTLWPRPIFQSRSCCRNPLLCLQTQSAPAATPRHTINYLAAMRQCRRQCPSAARTHPLAPPRLDGRPEGSVYTALTVLPVVLPPSSPYILPGDVPARSCYCG